MDKEFYINDEILASHGQRFANYIIDFVAQLILFFFLLLISLVISSFLGFKRFYDFQNLNTIQEYLLGAFIIIIYYLPFELFSSRSLGKYITKTIVVDENGLKPSPRQIIKRSFCRVIPFEAFSFLGSPCKGWHDSLSDTYVVKKYSLEEEKKLFYSLEEIGKDTEN
jgi:uncharacterized RDD family membrane protein YckC